tara:strand:+ start:1487 stop:1738 length:252 start_codon:yes stop_codon:yes gene_type:complete
MTATRSARPLVLASLENGDGTRCVDLFRRADGTFGFEEYRRDPEDPRGWSGAAGFGARIFADETAVRNAARTAVKWLSSGAGD